MKYLAAIVVAAALWLANPRKPPLKTCPTCGSGNEADRTTCRNCGARL